MGTRNPFHISKPVKEPAYFVGRKKIIRQIFSAMSKFQNVSIRGERRLGKTSLLHYLAHPDSLEEARLPATHIPVFFNFNPPIGLRIDSLWIDLAKTVEEQINRRISGKEAESRKFFAMVKDVFDKKGDVVSAFSKALSELSDCNINFLFDEFDKTKNTALGESFYHSLRSLYEENKNISYVIAAHTSACPGLNTLQMDYEEDDPRLIRLSAFQENEVRDLIAPPYFSQEEMSAGLAQRLCNELPSLYELTGYHPFFIQIYCHHLYRRLDMPGWPLGQAWEEALEAFKKQAGADLRYYWQVSSSAERELTEDLAMGFSIDWNKPKIQQAAEKLKNRGLLISPAGAEKSWRLFSSFYGDWVKITYKNPFIYGRPVQPHELVNRKRELSTLFNRLRNRESTAITGGSHIGKTSLLLALKDADTQERYAGRDIENFLFHFLDLRTIDKNYTFGRFWEDTLQIERETADHAGVTDCLRECTQKEYSHFSLQRLFETLAERDLTLVLLLDEFDRLFSHPNFKTSPEFFGSLCSLATTSGSLAVITASRQSLAKINQWGKTFLDGGVSFFNHYIEVKLKSFDGEAVEEFFAPHKNRFTEQEIDMLRFLAGPHPFLLQAAAAAWLDADGDKDTIEDMFYDRVSSHIDTLWNTLNDEMRAVALILCLAELSKKTFDCKRIKTVDNFVHQLRILAELGLVQKNGEKWPCDLSVPLEYKGESWMLSSRAFTRWVREVVIKGTRPVSSYDEWLKNKKYEVFLSRETWESLLRPPAA